MKPDFEPGDLVRLKSGGPKMTVTHVGSTKTSCCWFVSDQEHRAAFHNAALKRSGGRLTGDVFERYSEILKHRPVNTLGVLIKRTTEPKHQYVVAGPKSGTALREKLTRIHDECVPAVYEVIFVDNTTKQWLGKGQISLPDTRPGFTPKKKSRRPQ